MAVYQEVTIKETWDTDKGPKSKNRKVLVDAESVTEAEAKTVASYKGATIAFEVVSVKASPINEIIK